MVMNFGRISIKQHKRQRETPTPIFIGLCTLELCTNTAQLKWCQLGVKCLAATRIKNDEKLSASVTDRFCGTSYTTRLRRWTLSSPPSSTTASKMAVSSKIIINQLKSYRHSNLAVGRWPELWLLVCSRRATF